MPEPLVTPPTDAPLGTCEYKHDRFAGLDHTDPHSKTKSCVGWQPSDAPRPGEPTPLLVRKSKDDQIEYWRDQYLAAESRATTAERELTKEPGTRSEVITVLRDQLAAAESRATTVEQERDEYKRELIKTLEADQFKPDPKVLEAQRDEAWERLRKLDMIGDELAAAESRATSAEQGLERFKHFAEVVVRKGIGCQDAEYRSAVAALKELE